MKPRTHPRRWPAWFFLLAGLASLEAALAAGGLGYAKRVDTPVLAEPRVTAATVGTLAYGRKVQIDQAQGNWRRVREGQTAGWVFAGNLADTAPAANKGLDGLGLSASATSATAAARPLSPAAEDYASRRNLATARDDLNWLLTQSQLLSPAKIDTFLRETKKGEYQ